MTQFIQIHALTSYPPANLNRDDLGRPKTAVLGGSQRLRISSQCLKRTWRTSDVYEESVGDHMGVRTKSFGQQVYDRFIENQVAEKSALKLSHSIADAFGKAKVAAAKVKSRDDLDIEQLVHISPDERQAVMELADLLAKEGREPEKKELELLRKQHQAVDIAMFGRMIAAAPKYNTEAAVQVAHAITVHAVDVEDDFFSAVDDLNDGEVDAGSAHLGDVGFGAGVFYVYACINANLLVNNLSDNKELAAKSASALMEAMLTEAPSGKQNSFGSRAYASYALVESSTHQPRNLSVAFLSPRKGQVNLAQEIENLQKTRSEMDKAYGIESTSVELNVHGDGGAGLADLKTFVAQEVGKL